MGNEQEPKATTLERRSPLQPRASDAARGKAFQRGAMRTASSTAKVALAFPPAGGVFQPAL